MPTCNAPRWEWCPAYINAVAADLVAASRTPYGTRPTAPGLFALEIFLGGRTSAQDGRAALSRWSSGDATSAAAQRPPRWATRAPQGGMQKKKKK